MLTVVPVRFGFDSGDFHTDAGAFAPAPFATIGFAVVAYVEQEFLGHLLINADFQLCTRFAHVANKTNGFRMTDTTNDRALFEHPISVFSRLFVVWL